MKIQDQNRVIFEPEKLDKNYGFKLPHSSKEIFIPVEPGISLNGLLYEKSENKYLLLYFQGNAKNLQNFIDNHNMVLEWGYNVLVTDYRGFGKSDGMLNGQNMMYEDAEKVYTYSVQLGYTSENIILYGYSMGTSLTAHLASVKKAKALILESAYSSISEIDWVNDQAPDYELNTAERAKRIEIPTLLIHGENDDVIPPDHSTRIFDNLKTIKKTRVVLKGGGHGDLRKRPEYKRIINAFINQNP